MKSKFVYGISLVLLILLGVAVITAAGPRQSPGWNTSTIVSGSTCKVVPATISSAPSFNFVCPLKNDSTEDYGLPATPRVYIRQADGVLATLVHASVSSDVFIPAHRTVSVTVSAPYSDLCTIVSSSCVSTITLQDALNGINQGLGQFDGLTLLDEGHRREIALQLPKHI